MVQVVLYAEDDPDDVYLLQRVREPWQSEIDFQFVRDGAEAVAYLSGAGGFADRRMHPLPRLIILDINMPRMTGFDTLAWLREQAQFATTPVLIVSSSSEIGDVTRAYALGASAYVVKPLEIQKFKRALQAACGFFLKMADRAGNVDGLQELRCRQTVETVERVR